MEKNILQEKLKLKLKEMFQVNDLDLDFGIYKIMKIKRKQIEDFIEKKLIEEIEKQFKNVEEEEKKKIEEKLKELESDDIIKKYLDAIKQGNESIIEVFKDIDKVKEYLDAIKQLEEIKFSEELEGEIYNHLINFFSRYYENGDFIPKRRYKKNETYCIPYNGEEVYLHWVTKDMYYIKTTELFKNYRFKVEDIKVNFKITYVEEEKGNVKSQKKKFFVLNEKIFEYNKEKKELTIYFEYRTLDEKKKKNQDEINKEIFEILKEKLKDFEELKPLFEIIDNNKNDYRKYLLGRHIYKYTKKNTTDFFIHKDLKGFLEKELDFYIENEILKISNFLNEKDPDYFGKLRKYLLMVKVFKKIASKIIDFLSQIENFQKMLWEKKKFVINTHYVITLDKIKEYVGEEFLENEVIPIVLRSDKQLEEWKELFGIEVKDEKDLIEKTTLNGKEWKKLPIDTRYFDEEFKWKLLSALTKEKNLDEILDGILIKSENWQALNLLLEKYREKIQTIYIDPPYNTGNDDFLYKDNYQHSSWLTMMENRLSLAKELMREDSAIFVSIDDNELYNLKKLMENIFNNTNFISNFIWRKRAGGGSDSKFISVEHDYILVFSKNMNEFTINRLLPKDSNYPFVDEKGKYTLKPLHNPGLRDSLSLHYDIICPDGTILKGSEHQWVYSKETFEKLKKENKIVFKKTQSGWKVYYKVYKNETKGQIPFSILYKLSLNANATKEMKEMGFSYYTIKEIKPKPQDLIKYILYISSNKFSCILDFFAGSGTTAHAVMKLNKEDSGKRRFILIEMAYHFNTVLIPRIKKAAYSFDWKEGKPQDVDGIGIFFKYHTLEQYEDTLENIATHLENLRNNQTNLYEYDDYIINYMLQWESKNANVLLNIDKLKDPFNYKIKIIENYEPQIVNVDLIETFNYLLGIEILKYRIEKKNGRKYIFVYGKKDNKNILIIWRNIENIDHEKDKKFIEEKIKEYNFEPDEIYINGNSLLNNYQQIETIFKSKLFKR
jgi:adenine-specific DNA-methyltransferase